jgi:hypothetical protein
MVVMVVVVVAAVVVRAGMVALCRDGAADGLCDSVAALPYHAPLLHEQQQ